MCIEKGQKYLIEAFPLIKKRFPDSKLIIVGEGALQEALEARITELKLTDSIILTGYRDDVPRLLRQFNVFVLPSLTEGMPNSLIEAMACSLPCIASNIRSCQELIEDNVTGLLIDPLNIAMIADKVIYILENSNVAKSMGNAARRKIERNFNIEKTAENLEMVYNELIELKLQ